MSVAIQQTTFGATVDGRVVLSRASMARGMVVGGGWSQLRIGLRFAVGDSGGDILGTPRLYIGCLSNPAAGLSNGPLTNATSNFLGVVSDSWAWIHSASGYTLSPFSAAVKVGSTLAVAGVGGSMRLSLAPATKRRAVIVLIDKGTDGNADWKVGMVYHSTTDDPDISLTMLTNAMEASPNEPVLSTRLGAIRDVLNLEAGFVGLYASAVLSSTLVVDESVNGDLNSLCVGWGRSFVPVYLSEFLYAAKAV